MLVAIAACTAGIPHPAKTNTSMASLHPEIPHDPTLPISLTTVDNVKNQLYKCWAVKAGAAHVPVVTIGVWLNRDGSLVDARYTENTAANMHDPAYRDAAEAAMRAVHLCTPLTGLPPDKYEGWSYIEFTFDLAEMLR